ncbi:Os12g0144000 [Oryza sativa Japonica Group]|uniref:Os12g0144000 protein n=1 Tax=Oryza sativa subsp. japonica TaxID=39947 RepID=Q0IQ56_ORYSJ|nr:Os12g0144000 [Oryza sativa Japonica Group]|eukprot:NP_001066140.2 Os12g0144000 [Oryza sativa Japonica Group]
MADLLRREEEFYASLFDSPKGGDAVKSRGQMIERKIEVLEDMATKVSNRRSRRWLNDRLLIELVPRLHVEEIKGLFAPPPWGKLQCCSHFLTPYCRSYSLAIECSDLCRE